MWLPRERVRRNAGKNNPFPVGFSRHFNKDKITPATHMWLQNYENLLFVPVRSLRQCEIMTKQAAMINSSEGHCYLNENLIKKIECTKPLKKSGQPSCS